METQEASPAKSLGTRHRCSACYKQYKKKEHLIAHMKVSYHSVHQPKCDICYKHCKSLESLREHLIGPLPKANCSNIFSERGCDLCLKLFDSQSALTEHRETCCLPAPCPFEMISVSSIDSQVHISDPVDGCNYDDWQQGRPKTIALDCEMVGGGSDGSLDLCARVCLVDEDENLTFHSYVQPQIPVTDYRYEVTGLTEEQLRDAMPLKEVRERILEILYNGESIGKVRLDGGKARLLVGHDIEHDLDCLRMNYPDHLLRDTAKYRPLMRTNLVSHSLKYLTRKYLGYDIQCGLHDPYEDCVSVMRIYKRMRAQDHQLEGAKVSALLDDGQNLLRNFEFSNKELEKMSPDELHEISRSNYRCWCLDSKRAL